MFLQSKIIFLVFKMFQQKEQNNTCMICVLENFQKLYGHSIAQEAHEITTVFFFLNTLQLKKKLQFKSCKVLPFFETFCNEMF